MERYDTFQPIFATPAHDLKPLDNFQDFAKEQLNFSIEQVIFWVEVAECWAQEFGSSKEGFADLNLAKISAELAKITALKK